jgi:hypothetical protein
VTRGNATLTLGTNTDPRLDSLIVLEFALEEVPVESDIDLTPTDWSTR